MATSQPIDDAVSSRVQTIEAIEARAAEVQEAERHAIEALVFCMREIAVRCPAESQLPLELAKASKHLSLYFHGGDPATGVSVTFGMLGLTGLAAEIARFLPPTQGQS